MWHTRDLRLRKVLTVGDPAENLLIQGDAGVARAGLLSDDSGRSFAGPVRLCYIDPPCNTGERFEHYDYRADRAHCLSTLRDHLLCARQSLAPDESSWLHIDDSEQHRARCVLDGVFGEDALVFTVVWQQTSRESRKAFSSMHDYIHVYAPLARRGGSKSETAFRITAHSAILITIRAGHGDLCR